MRFLAIALRKFDDDLPCRISERLRENSDTGGTLRLKNVNVFRLDDSPVAIKGSTDKRENADGCNRELEGCGNRCPGKKSPECLHIGAPKHT